MMNVYAPVDPAIYHFMSFEDRLQDAKDSLNDPVLKHMARRQQYIEIVRIGYMLEGILHSSAWMFNRDETVVSEIVERFGDDIEIMQTMPWMVCKTGEATAFVSLIA